jgi:Helix-turn-helix of insertion element transposase
VPKKIEVKKPRAILLLASGKSVVDTARDLGCSRVTIHNWLNDPQFQDELNKAKIEWLDECRSELRLISKIALKTLWEMVHSGNRPHGPQVKAIELALKATGIITEFKPEIETTEIEMKFPGPADDKHDNPNP